MLRQSMEMMRNPAAMQQAMRNQDLQMSQIENLPGGFNALQRMFEDVQQPLMEAAAASQQPRGSAAGGNTTATPNQTAPATAALPNPWGGGSAAPAAGAGGAFNPFAAMGGMGGAPGANPFAAMGGMGG